MIKLYVDIYVYTYSIINDVNNMINGSGTITIQDLVKRITKGQG